MIRQTRAFLLGATIVAGATFAMPVARAGDTAQLTGHVGSWVAAATKTGASPDTQQVDIAVHLKLRDVDGLTALATAVSKPGGTHYGEYITRESVRERFAPEDTDVQAVYELLRKAGMTELTVGPSNAYVTARATVAQLRTTFRISQDLYVFHGTTLRANAEEPTVPAALASKIVYIEGLDDRDLLRVPQHHSATMGDLVVPKTEAAQSTSSNALSAETRKAVPAATVTPPPVASNTPSPYCSTYYGDTVATLSTKADVYGKKIPWLTCGYTPRQIQEAYGFEKVTLDGTGVVVAIVDAYASPTLAIDENRYATNHKLPPLTADNFTQIIPKGIYSVSPKEACMPYGWWSEESLDVAAVHGTAPGAQIVYIGARDCGTALTVALENAVYNQQADVITNSYSYNGESTTAADIANQDQTFMVAATEGITLLFSSGDDGDLSQLQGVATGAYQSTSPYVTGVGGTSLALRNAKGKKEEWGWGTYRDFLAGVTVNSASSVTTSGLATATATVNGSTVTYDAFSFYAGAGGGISLVEPQPSYQANVVPAALATTLNEGAGSTVPLTPRRVAPDISAVADPYTGYLFPETYTIANDGHSDIGCLPLTATTEYCEYTIGGTSLASPVTAGVMAVWNQARLAAGSPTVGFVNPLLYSLPVASTLTGGAINDVLPPATPTSVLRGYVNNLSELRLVTINSVPTVYNIGPFQLELSCAPDPICEGLDDIFNFVTPGYDDVTGLGVPYVPLLVTQ